MGVEIERKFLVRGAPWRGHQGTRLEQGYLADRQGVVVRVRVAGERGRLTVKGPTEGISRAEFEYEVPKADAVAMLALCGTRLVTKTRYRIEVGGHTWDVDHFDGLNEGLAMAEVELASEDEDFVRPDWLGEEVSDDARYANASLAERPFSTWSAP